MISTQGKYFSMIKNNYNVLMGMLVLGLIFSTYAKAQESNLGNWLMYIGSKKINSKWNIHNEIQYRNYNGIGDLEQLLLRTGLGYNFKPNYYNVLLGYSYILSENYIDNAEEKESINEHRIFQQFTSKQKVGIAQLNHRYRFEQRFVESDFKMRFRYFLSINIPFSKEENNKLYFSAYNEIFLNLESEIFDRNRLYGGIGYNINKDIRFELGYMNQFFETTNQDQLNIVSLLNV